jgi:uncharacterized membrane protein
VERLTVWALLIVFGEAIFWFWTFIVNGVLALAGFPQDKDDETTLPNWVGWSVLLLALIAIGVLIYSELR